MRTARKWLSTGFGTACVNLLILLCVVAVLGMSLWYDSHDSEYRGAFYDRVNVYRDAHRMDPILALEGTNPERLEGSIDRLGDSLNVFVGQYALTQERVLRQALYPISFLKKLPELERRRVALQEESSYTSALSYHTKLIETLYAYRAALETYSATLSAFPDRAVMTYQGPTRRSRIEHATQELIASAEESLAREKRRFSCLGGGVSRCKVTPPPPPKESSRSTLVIDELPATVKEHRDILLGAQGLGSSYVPITPIPRSSRVVALTSQKCNVGDDVAYMLIEQYVEPDTLHIIPRMTFLDDLLFFSTERTQPSESPHYLSGNYSRYLARLKELDNLLYFENVAPYFCLESPMDAARTLTLLELESQLKNEVGGAGALGARTSDIEAAAERLLSSRILSDANAETFIQTLQSHLGSPQLYKAFEENRGHEETMAAEKRITLWRGSSARLDALIDAARVQNDSLAFLGQFESDLEYLFLTRSYPELFFLPFNQTLVSRDISFIETEAPLGEQAHGRWLLYRSDRLDDLYPPETITMMIRRQKEDSRKIAREYLSRQKH